MKLYNFDRLIDKYSVDFMLITASEGGYVSGRYVEGERTETAYRGAIFPISDGKVYQSGGTYTTKDRQLIMRTPIEKPLTNAKVVFKGNEYSIERSKDFGDYANVYNYDMKWVSAVSD